MKGQEDLAAPAIGKAEILAQMILQGKIPHLLAHFHYLLLSHTCLPFL
jgi:hypothetical protein